MPDSFPDLLTSFANASRFSSKLSSYFADYELMFSSFRNQKVTIVEIGVLDGGSLQMWKTFFGPSARVIGVEANPEALNLVAQGFEIYIINQENANSWRTVLPTIGNIDILIDDGGHTSLGQIMTCLETVNFINDGGLIVIEDTHSSFLKEFGMPSRYSFSNWVSLIEKILDLQYLNKSEKVSAEVANFAKRIRSITKFRSMTVFSIHSELTAPQLVSNQRSISITRNAMYDTKSKIWKFANLLREASEANFQSIGNTNTRFKFLNPLFTGNRKRFIRKLLTPASVLLSFCLYTSSKFSNRNLAQYFE